MTITQKGFAEDFAEIKETWEGLSLSKVRTTIQTDLRGRTIGKTEVTTALTGVISSISNNPRLRGIGWVSEQNSVGFFDTTDLEVGDYIVWTDQSITYEIVQIVGNIYDVDDPVASTVELRRVE